VVEIKAKMVEQREGKRGGIWSKGKKGKEGEGGRLALDIWPGGHTWPPLNSHFHSSPHLAPLMLTLLTKSIKSKANSLHLFPRFYLFLFEIFRFYDMQ
jgi:hypothetical protein